MYEDKKQNMKNSKIMESSFTSTLLQSVAKFPKANGAISYFKCNT